MVLLYLVLIIIFLHFRVSDSDLYTLVNTPVALNHISEKNKCLIHTVAQSVENATCCEEVKGSIPAVDARSLLVGSVSV